MADNLEQEFIRFSDILGQDKAKKILIRSIQHQRVSHAYLFTGIPGIGKTSTAKALAVMLNCKDRQDGEPCGRCVSCRQMRNGNFPDFIQVQPDGNVIKIDQIRELQKSLRFAPVSNGYRVCAIDQAEAMTEEASNAFLKSLEEPPPDNVFILNAIEPMDLLPTIVSRCQRISFSPLGFEEIKAELLKRLDVDEKTATVLSRISEGSLGKALAMAQTDYLEKRESWLLRLLGLRKLSSAEALELGNQLAADMKKQALGNGKYEIGGLMDMLATWSSWYRDLLLIREGAGDHLLINYNFSRQLQKEAVDYRIEQLSESLFLIDRAQRDLRLRRNPSLVLERTILELKRVFETLNLGKN